MIAMNIAIRQDREKPMRSQPYTEKLQTIEEILEWEKWSSPRWSTLMGCSLPNSQPRKQTSNRIWTERLYLGIYMYMNTLTIIEKRGHKLGEWGVT